MDDEKPCYYAMLTADVRYDKRLKPAEKLLYAEISSLLNMNGKCFASNEYFAKLYEVSEQSISNYLANLKKYGYINMDYIRNGATVERRYIWLCNTVATEEQVKTKAKKPALVDREPVNELEEIEKIYLQNYRRLYEQGVVRTEKPIMNWKQARVLEKKCIEEYGKDLIVQAVDKSLMNDFVVSKGYLLTMILSAGILGQIVNGNTRSKSGAGIRTGQGVDEWSGDVEF